MTSTPEIPARPSLGRSLSGSGARTFDAFELALRHGPVWFIAVVALCALQVALIFTHEPWLDEWQALQLSLQSPTIHDLLSNLRYEGHPPLWYFILRAIGLVADPFWVLPIAAAGLALFTQSLILLRSPFCRTERLMLASGCFIMFEFLTLSRSMTLGVAVLVAAVTLWRSRWVWLAIALLPMCDFLFGVLSLLLAILQLRDRGRWWAGIALWAVGSAVATWLVLPAPDMLPAIPLAGPLLDAYLYFDRIGILLLPLQWGNGGPAWNGRAPLGLGPLLAVGFFVLGYFQNRSDRLHQILFWGFVAVTFCFSVTVYPLHVRHLMLIALLLILLAWLRAAEGTAPNGAFRAWLGVGAVCGLTVAAINLVQPFDTARHAAAEIHRRGLQDKLWLAFPDGRGQGISALTGMKFERTEQRCMQEFPRWNYRTSLNTPQRFTAYLRGEVTVRGRFYLLSNIDLAEMPADLVRPIAHIPGGYDSQSYRFYVVGPGLPETSVRPPRCVTGMRPLAAARVWPPAGQH